MPASCASLPATTMRRSVCSSDLSILRDDTDKDIAKRERKKRGPDMDSASKPSRKKVGQSNTEYTTKDAAEQSVKVDERLRLARVRREQQQKELATREQGWLAREARAQRHYEKHLEERRRKLEEQRLKEERRRRAVEEKRRQRISEERERYEEVLKRTLERSQQAKQKSLLARQARLKARKAPRCRPLSKWEQDLVRRLQTPTIAHLARSRSVGAPDGHQVFHCCRRSASSHHEQPSSTPKMEPKSSSSHRQSTAIRLPLGQTPNKSTKKGQGKQRSVRPTGKESPKKGPRPQLETVFETVTPASSPDPPPDRPVIRAVSRRPASLPEGHLPPLLEEESDLGSQCDTPPHSREPVGGDTELPLLINRVIMNGDPPEEQIEEGNLDTPPPPSDPNQCPPSPPQHDSDSHDVSPVRASTQGDLPSSPLKPSPPADVACSSKTSAGTLDAEEASRVMAEKRKQARQQREERRREEFERKAREELIRREAVEKQQLEMERQREEEKRQMEDRRNREEEEHRQMQEEAILREKRLKEEEEAIRQKVLELKRQRDQHFQKEEEERQERKRRLEQIMKRTRKADSLERKPVSTSANETELEPKENTEPNGNNKEEVILLSVPSPTHKLELDEDVPSVSFKERRSLRTLTGLDHIQSQQRAEVI